jgi:hypothetical protein
MLDTNRLEEGLFLKGRRNDAPQVPAAMLWCPWAGHLDNEPKIDPVWLAVMAAIAFAALIALTLAMM